jgi:methionyl aminopeptidase
MVTLKNQAEIDRMRVAGRVVAATLSRVAAAAEAGITLRELDEIGAACIREHGATPSFLHYRPGFASTPYPATLCLSVNDVIVHGIPGDQVLAEGDILSIDGGAIVDGFHGDAAVTVPVGTVDEAATRLMDVTRRSLDAAIRAAVPGGRMGDIGSAVEKIARDNGLGILAGCGGHGIGTAMHEDPSVPNTGRAGRGMKLKAGLVIAIEPMLIESGGDEGYTLSDGWSIATTDGSRAAHFEHSIAITKDGPVILTLP